MSPGPPDRPPSAVRRPGKAGPVAVIEGFAGRRSVVPFAILVLCLLAIGLVLLLLLNTALDRGAFEIQAAQKRESQLTDQQQELQLRLAGLSAPGALASQAAALGLVPNPRPVFLDPGSGAVLGVPTPAPTTAPPARPTSSAASSPSPSASQSPSASATASASPGVSGRAMPPANAPAAPAVPSSPSASPKPSAGALALSQNSTTPTASASATGSRP
ncbi:MAG TPA: hypothetical protein VFU65_11955 [Actinocrinis sp.]|nr:hypothetical protein [Actinocrinis sp.]